MGNTVLCLLIDDDADDHEIFEMALQELHWRPYLLSAFDADEGLSMLRQPGAPRPDVIFLDLNMPRVDGKQFLCELKTIPGMDGIPIVIYSTSSEIVDLVETSRLGASAFIVKSSSLEELKSALENVFAEMSVR